MICLQLTLQPRHWRMMTSSPSIFTIARHVVLVWDSRASSRVFSSLQKPSQYFAASFSPCTIVSMKFTITICFFVLPASRGSTSSRQKRLSPSLVAASNTARLHSSSVVLQHAPRHCCVVQCRALQQSSVRHDGVVQQLDRMVPPSRGAVCLCWSERASSVCRNTPDLALLFFTRTCLNNLLFPARSARASNCSGRNHPL